MRLLVTLFVAALAGLGGQRLGVARAAGKTPSIAAGQDLAPLLERVQELRGANERLAQEIERRAGLTAPPVAPVAEIGDDQIAAALARWREAHPEEARAASERRGAVAARTTPDELDLASVPMNEIVRALAQEGFGREGSQELFQKLRDAGRIDEYVAAIEALTAADPENAELQVALGHAYLQQLFGVGHAPEQQGALAMKADAAFDRALELDDQNWAARFSKAVSLSNWPDFMGRGPEAIEHFETLLEQQAAVPKRDEFAMTYLFLGNMQQAGGQREKAVATWRAGLELFPGMEELQRAIELAGTDGAKGRPAQR